MSYTYPYLKVAQKVAREQGLPTPYSSQRAGKKLYVVYKGKEIHFGNRDYEDFLDHEDSDRRRKYRSRARGILLANGKPAYLNKNQPAYYAYRILW